MVDVLPEVAVVFPHELIQLRKLLAYAAGVFDAVLPELEQLPAPEDCRRGAGFAAPVSSEDRAVQDLEKGRSDELPENDYPCASKRQSSNVKRACAWPQDSVFCAGSAGSFRRQSALS